MKLTRVLFLLALDGSTDHILESAVRGSVPQSVSEGDFALSLEQTNLKISIGRYSETIARVAEVLAHRGDKPDSTNETWNRVRLRREHEYSENLVQKR